MRRRLPREAWVLTSIAFLIMVGFGVVLPVLPVYARTFGASNFLVSVVVASFALFRLLTSPATGWLQRWLGGGVMLVVGILIVAASSAAMGFASSYAQLLAFRALGGIGSAMFTVSALSVLLASVPADARGQASGLYSGGFMLGAMAGPAIGGLLAGISLNAPFFFYALTLVAAAVVGWVLLPREAGGSTSTAAESPLGFREALGHVGYRASGLANFAQGWQSMGVRSALVPLFVVEVLGEGPQWTGVAFAVAAAVQMVSLTPIGRLVDTGGRRRFLVLGALVTGLASLALPWAWSPWVLLAILCVYGLGASMLSTAPTAAVGDVTGGRPGTAIAAYSMASDIGGIVGPLAAGLLADRFGFPIAFGAGAALILAAGAYALRMPAGVNADEPRAAR